MKKSSKRNIIVTSLAAIAAAGAVVVGSTYALFTSESKTNIAVTAGKVSVVATLDDLKTYSGVELTGDVAADSAEPTAVAGVFTNGGTAKIENNELVLDKMTPGDKVEFDIKVTNNSDVAVQYRTIIKTTEDNGLFFGLKVTIGEEEFNGLTSVSKLETLAVGSAEEKVHVVIELPSDAGNEYQGKSTKISYAVEAYQGNAAVDEPAADELCLYNSTDLVAFGKLANSGKIFNAPYAGYKHYTLMGDVDMSGIDWDPISFVSGPNYVFDGNGYSVKNLTVSQKCQALEEGGEGGKGCGFFKVITSMTIKDLTLDGADITGIGGWVGGIVGGSYAGTLENCHVINSKITAKTWEVSEGSWNDGDKVGGIIGSANEGGLTMKKCSVKDTVITGYRDMAALAGHIGDPYDRHDTVIQDSVAEDVEIKIDRSHNYKEYKEDATAADQNVNDLVGRDDDGQIDLSTNTVTNVTKAFLA